jgi:hypothetical protein
VTLRIVWRLNDRIGLQEASNHRVVNAPVHVNQAELGQMLVACEAALIAVQAVSRVAPRAEAVHDEAAAAGAGEGVFGHHAAQVVAQQEPRDGVGAAQLSAHAAAGVLWERLSAARFKACADRGGDPVKPAHGGNAGDDLAALVALYFEAARNHVENVIGEAAAADGAAALHLPDALIAGVVGKLGARANRAAAARCRFGDRGGEVFRLTAYR